MNRHDDWQALQYILDDPTLDRAACEARMSDDVDFALAVADAVEFVERVRAAASSVGLAQPTSSTSAGIAYAAGPSGEAASGWHWSSIAALAAALLVAIGVGFQQLGSYHSHNGDRTTGVALAPSIALDANNAARQHSVSQQFMAERWLAIRHETLAAEPVDVVADSVVIGDESRDFLPGIGEGEADEGEDWMLEAAREFYTQGVAS